jgi:hypothetical protein
MIFKGKLLKKKLIKKEKQKAGRPKIWGPDEKFNKTFRLSKKQQDLIYENFPTLQAFFESYFLKFEKDVEKKEALKLNLIA